MTTNGRGRRVDCQQVERVCGSCGTTFWLRPAVVKPVNYCSRACAAKRWVGVPKSPKAIAQQRAKVTGRPNPAITRSNQQRVGPLNAKWAGDYATPNAGRSRAGRYYEIRPCEVCGVEPIDGKRNVHRHHKDRNPLNNDPTNIAFLCRRHHGEAHRGVKRTKVTP